MTKNNDVSELYGLFFDLSRNSLQDQTQGNQSDDLSLKGLQVESLQIHKGNIRN